MYANHMFILREWGKYNAYFAYTSNGKWKVKATKSRIKTLLLKNDGHSIGSFARDPILEIYRRVQNAEGVTFYKHEDTWSGKNGHTQQRVYFDNQYIEGTRFDLFNTEIFMDPSGNLKPNAFPRDIDFTKIDTVPYDDVHFFDD